ncbi:universal stress protein [Pseudonocardia charpentierae]|uniref:Universal stress protein n=1 Tax=Pseudonocardia charpentierae TaxID=3075545 RepID=A0ABU2NFE4_9PSEU|nr:universal stress protein [Pseudonocardia sp. DSM 45834]MDT0352687.1 universal stress protein [Pseudonocardia sp. DSM 45834]
MTVIAGFSSSRQGVAPLHLATQLARTTGEKIIAAVVVERPLPAGVDPIEDEYRGYVAAQATASLERVVTQISGDFDISVVTHHATSVPNGLMELVAEHSADLVVVGSSSSGLLGRIALGTVTERLVYTSQVPVAIAPRGYPSSPAPVRRLTAAYRVGADAAELIATSAELAKRWGHGCGSRRSRCGRSRCSAARSSARPRSSSSSSGHAERWTPRSRNSTTSAPRSRFPMWTW